MRNEIKISLPLSKISYSLFFIVILSLICGITASYEIGIKLEPAMAILAAAFCADTYVQEVTSRRSEIERLYPMKKRICSVGTRLLIQELFLLLLAAAGYGLFFLFQKPILLSALPTSNGDDLTQFFVCLAAVAVTLCFWGSLSNTLACLFRSLWVGFGGCLLLWLITNSTFGDRYLGSWNIFSYRFRNAEDSGDFSWLAGKGVCIVFCIAMTAILPKLLKRRG
ncbi:MAG: hypothetical protein HDQ98_10655 [Lachnospiraceae bacterium]|nr:hypothetical protein [Lachnospiraceae bacterium]